MELGLSAKVKKVRDEVRNFIDHEIRPKEREYFDEVEFNLEDWQWRDMGLAYTADILVLDKASVLDFDKLDLY